MNEEKVNTRRKKNKDEVKVTKAHQHYCGASSLEIHIHSGKPSATTAQIMERYRWRGNEDEERRIVFWVSLETVEKDKAGT